MKSLKQNIQESFLHKRHHIDNESSYVQHSIQLERDLKDIFDEEYRSFDDAKKQFNKNDKQFVIKMQQLTKIKGVSDSVMYDTLWTMFED